MQGRFRSQWENVSNSLWFVPGLCIVALTCLALVVPELDRRIHARFLFPGDAGAARAVLQVVAGSLITVISLVFSITILVLQQASQQYTPRLIGNFMGFRGVQIVLGVFLGTFLYSLLTLRFLQESTDDAPEYVPEISVVGVMLLATICICLLVYFIHHTAVSIEVPAVARRITSQVHAAIGDDYPRHGKPLAGNDDLASFKARHQASIPVVIRADTSGFVRWIDEERVINAVGGAQWIAILIQVGTYVHPGSLLAEIGGVEGLDGERVKKLRDAIALDIERSLHQDPLFGIRQLVDIALRALSPSLNDPTTAEHALSQLADLLIALGRQPYTSRMRVVDTGHGGQLELWAARVLFADYVDTAFSQIRRMAYDKPHVTTHLLSVIEAVGRNMHEPRTLEPLRCQIHEVLDALATSNLRPTDREAVLKHAQHVLHSMESAHDAVAGSTTATLEQS